LPLGLNPATSSLVTVMRQGPHSSGWLQVAASSGLHGRLLDGRVELLLGDPALDGLPLARCQQPASR
jgi:hypothetical protein